MTRGNRMRMMIVVPAFAPRKKRHQKIIRRQILGRKSPRPPHMRDRVHHPGSMQIEHDPREDSPEQPGQATDRIEDDADDDV